jgi:D-glycero-D-manno-heptose 1,7-bisphosphate phosphatase
MGKPAFFFDRDGTLIKDKNYICDFSEVEIFDFSVEAVRIAEKRGFIPIGITNQSSIARGICTVEQVELIHRGIRDYFKKRNANILKIYYCPFLKGGKIDKYNRDDDCRKPKSGMILKATKEIDINLKNSYMIGDSIRDIIAGINAGCKTALVLTGNGKEAKEELNKKGIKPDIIADNILEVVKMF